MMESSIHYESRLVNLKSRSRSRFLGGNRSTSRSSLDLRLSVALGKTSIEVPHNLDSMIQEDKSS